MSGVQKFPRGSEWRKWDLHVHTPGTKLSDDYSLSELDQEEINRVNELYERCENKLVNVCLDEESIKEWLFWVDYIHNSDVSLIGVTDYFSLENFFLACEIYNVYKSVNGISESESVVFFPNIELRTDDTMNKKNRYVNIHIIFSPEISKPDWDKLKNSMTVTMDGWNGAGDPRLVDIMSKADAEGATVKRDNIIKSLKSVYGDNYKEKCVLVVSGNDDGISMGANGTKKRTLAIFKEYVDICDGIFTASTNNINFWVNLSKGKGPKPCFGGSDSHSFDTLKKKLGKQGRDIDSVSGKSVLEWKTTWIKADPTFEGFLQVFIEPGERVKIQEPEPDFKYDYAWIKEVSFADNDMFPEKLSLNKNLNSVIGSRSSGKSALLSYIALANGLEDIESVAPGISLEKAREMGCSIKWADQIDEKKSSTNEAEISRKIVYIPQNKLFNIASNPQEVTKLIKDSVSDSYRQNISILQEQEREYRNSLSSMIDDYFNLEQEIQDLIDELRNYADIETLQNSYRESSEKLHDLQEGVGIDDEEKNVIGELNQKIASLESEIKKYEGYLAEGSGIIFNEHLFDNSIGIQGKCNPAALEEIKGHVSPIKQQIVNLVAEINEKYKEINESKLRDLYDNKREAKEELEPLNEKAEQSEALIKANKEHGEIGQKIKDVENIEARIADLKNRQLSVVDNIVDAQKSNNVTPEDIEKCEVGDAGIEIVMGYPKDYYDSIEQYVNQKSATKVNNYVSECNEFEVYEGEYDFSEGGQIDIKKLSEVISGDIKQFIDKQGNSENGGAVTLKGKPDNDETLLQTFIKKVLCYPREVRLVATYDGDKIGGYEESTMTPGKQAVFALELILSKHDSEWPLLIDQPEDDLDSRSIYDSIVPKIRELKKRRQIIMVSHDANMVVGSDSEEVIIVNRHGKDRKNKDGRYFDYLSGSLENTMLFDDGIEITLLSQGVREHCCVILDGGEEAFAKRKSKYNI